MYDEVVTVNSSLVCSVVVINEGEVTTTNDAMYESQLMQRVIIMIVVM